MKAKLTPKQAMFVKEYLIDLNATQAAIRAGYSQKTARIVAAQNLSKLNISEAIQEAMNERSNRVEVTADDVLSSIKLIRQMAIDSEKLGEALKANELLGKHIALFTDKIEAKHSGAIGQPELNVYVNGVLNGFDATSATI